MYSSTTGLEAEGVYIN